MASNHNSGIKVGNDGRVKRVRRETSITIRLTRDELERFSAACVLDAAIHGGEPNMARSIRSLMRMFADRTETVNASAEAKAGAKVLRKKAS